MGESGELVIGGVGLARYLDPDRRTPSSTPRCRRSAGTAPTAAATSSAPTRPGWCSSGGPTSRSSWAGAGSSSARSTPRCSRCPAFAARRPPCARTRAGNQLLVGYLVPDGSSWTPPPRCCSPRAAARRARAAARGGRRPADAHLGQGRPRRAAVAAARGEQCRPRRGGTADPDRGLARRGWTEILGVAVSDPKADFFDPRRRQPHRGPAGRAAPRPGTRRSPSATSTSTRRWGRSRRRLDALARDQDRASRTCVPTPRRAALAQAAAHGPAADSGRAALGDRRRGDLDGRRALVGRLSWTPTVSWWSLAAGWLRAVQPGRADRRSPRAAPGCCCAAYGPGSYPRGGTRAPAAVARRAARRAVRCDGLAERPVDHPLRPRARREDRPRRRPALARRRSPGMLKLGRGAAVEPEVDLSGYWIDGDVVHIGEIRIGAGATVGSRSTLLPGRADRQGTPRSRPGPRSAARSPPVSAGRARPRERAGKPGGPGRRPRPPRSRRWVLALRPSSLVLGLLPAVAALPRWRSSRSASRYGVARGGDERGARCWSPPPRWPDLVTYAAARSWSACGCSASACAEGYHPVHSRAGWQAWATERLMDEARTWPVPAVRQPVHAAWLRLLGAEDRPGRRGVHGAALPR